MLFDLSDRTQLELTGSDRAKFLHGFCTNDIKGLTPGRGCEAFVCNIQGKVLGHIFVFCTETSLWIDTVPGQEDVLFAHLDRYLINEDVQIHRRSAEFGELFLHGASAVEQLNTLGWSDAAELVHRPVLSHVTISAGDSAIQVRLVDWLGEPSWLISLPKPLLSDVTQRLITAGATRADVQTWNTLRIDAGFPCYGIDITSENLAQEVGRTDRCISFTKGCYLGQEPIARIDALGHVNRELRRLQIAGKDIPAPGTALLDPETGAQAGVVTSAATATAALGYLRTKFCPSGSQVKISSPSGDLFATVR